MKKIALMLLCLVMGLLVLIACDKSEDTQNSSESSIQTSNSSQGGSQEDDNGGNQGNVGKGKYDYDMGQYITVPSYKEYPVEIELDNLQKLIDSYILENATASRRTICMPGDVVNITYIGYKLDENGQILYENGRPVIFAESDNYGMYLGSKMDMNEFEENTVGMKIDDIKEIFVVLPEDYIDSSLAGQKVIFEIILNKVYDAPIYNDDFIKTISSELTVNDFEKSLKSKLVADAIYTYIFDNSIIHSYPEKEYDIVVNQLLSIEESIKQEYNMTVDEYLLSNFGMTRKEYIESELKKEMVYYAIAQLENVQITEEMLNNEKNALVEYYKNYYISKGLDMTTALKEANEIVQELGRDYIFENVLFEQVDGVIGESTRVTFKEATYVSVTTLLANRQNEERGENVGDMCPGFDLEVFDENGSLNTTINPSNNLGRITVINFWGTWCPYCLYELPDFERIAQEYSKDVSIFAIHTVSDYETAPDYILENFRESKMFFLKDFLKDSNNLNDFDACYDALGGAGYYPYTLVLDQSGRIVYKHTGRMYYDELKNIVDFILNGKADIDGVGEITLEQMLESGLSLERIHKIIASSSLTEEEKQNMNDILQDLEDKLDDIINGNTGENDKDEEKTEQSNGN